MYVLGGMTPNTRILIGKHLNNTFLSLQSVQLNPRIERFLRHIEAHIRYCTVRVASSSWALIQCTALCNPLQTIIVGLLKSSVPALTREQQTMTRLHFILKYSTVELRRNPTINQPSLRAYIDLCRVKEEEHPEEQPQNKFGL